MDTLNVRMLGGFTLRWDEQDELLLPNATTRALLAYLLAHHEQSHTRDLLSGLFWPDLPETIARRRLTQALWHIRKCLAPYPILLTEGDTVRLDPALSLWLDVAEFEQCAVSDAAQNVARAVALYRGEFLNGYYDDWLLPERERLRELFLVALERLIADCKARGDYQHALTHARRLAVEDPWRESAHCEVMRLCHLLGRDAEALKQYQVCRQVLADELGLDPAPETEALAAEIARQLPPETAPYLPSPLLEKEIDAARLPLIGREKERATLVAHLEAAFNGLGGLVLVEGEAGVGKTRLLREVARDAEWRGIEVLWGGAEPLAPAQPYGPLVDALAGGLSPLRIRQLAQVVERIWLQVLASLLLPLRVALPDLSPPLPLEPTQEQARLAAALGELLRGWAHITPLALIVEDLHWTGEDTLTLLARVLPALGESRVLLLGSYRSGEARARPEVWQPLQVLERAGTRQRIALSRLDAAASAKLIRLSLGIGNPAPLFEARLFAETDGNPLFLLETLHTLHSEGLLFRNAEGWWSTPWDASTDTYAELPLPQAVEQIIARHLDTLSPALRPIVHLTAVLGERFDFDLLRLASAAEPRVLLDALHELVRCHILDETDQDYRFHHDKIRQVAYGAIAATERAQLHRRTAEALESLNPDQTAALAYHWEGAAVWDKAADYHQQAGDLARAVYANQEAILHYTHALEALDRLPDPIAPERAFALHQAREAVYAFVGERRAQADELDALETWLAHPLLDTPTNRTHIGLRRATYYEVIGDYPRAFDAVREAAAQAALTLDVQAEYQAELTWGRMLRHRGELELARQHSERAWALAQELDDLTVQAVSLKELGDLAFDQGNYGAALTMSLRALDLSVQSGVETVQANVHTSLGNIAHYLADFPAALEHHQQALSLRRTLGDRRGEASSLYNFSTASHDSGNPEAARAALERVCALAHSIGDRRIEGYGWVYLALVLEYLGQFDASRDAYLRGLTLRREVGLHALAIDALSGLARVATAQGDHVLAVQYADEVLAWLDERGPNGVGDPCLAYVGAYKALLAAGQTARGEAALRAAYALLMSYADSITDPERRRAYLHDIAPGRTIWDDYHSLGVRRIQACLPRAGAPLRRSLRDDERVSVTWTVAAPEDEVIIGKGARRQRRLARLLEEAAAQDAAPTEDDLADALEVSVATIKRDLETLRRQGTPVKTRGSPK
ncbi:MAG TPA: BTAD domain-containing putative transcriptional regulator [Anaerolineae bacterium]|nr:BTAD domain-containing putative transcriptional regulator [Anaerolineae bacterium]HQI84377.1 BTAD domain-containing putative transcriptional regulator [Anaerolineae bacterium]